MRSLLKFILSLSAVICLILLITLGVNARQGNEIILPDIGDPASQVLSINQEAEMGKIIMAQVNQRLPTSTDPELRGYLQSLGTRLISAGLNSDFPYYFTLVFDERINAFAMPGGIVAINSGLFTLTQTESELASVVAHEISHVSQRHIARRFSRQQQLSVMNTIALLGTVLAAIYGSPDAGMAAATVTNSQLQESAMAYSRTFEHEADRIGMALLVNARLDPYGMPHFFERLHNHSKINQNSMPEFLRSHPLTLDRVSESRARADQHKHRHYHETSIQYEYARARVIAISGEPKKLVKNYKKHIKSNPSNLNYYVYGLAQSRLGNGRAAVSSLKKIQPNIDEQFPVNIALAQANIVLGDNDNAVKILNSLEQLYPLNEAVIFYLATALMNKKDYRTALQKLDTLESTMTSNPGLEHLRARAADGAGMPWRSHEALSNYDLMHARFNSAMEQLLLAQRQTGIDKHSQARIEAKKQKIRDLQKQYSR
jgi:predicted Zn-dependent protease